jgi:predicted DNA-binding helix-hairpin-helix protein
MEVATKLKILADSAKYDASCASSGVTSCASLRPPPGGYARDSLAG